MKNISLTTLFIAALTIVSPAYAGNLNLTGFMSYTFEDLVTTDGPNNFEFVGEYKFNVSHTTTPKPTITIEQLKGPPTVSPGDNSDGSNVTLDVVVDGDHKTFNQTATYQDRDGKDKFTGDFMGSLWTDSEQLKFTAMFNPDDKWTFTTPSNTDKPICSESNNPTSLFVLCSHKFTGNEPEKPTMIRSTGTYWEYEINIDERDLFNSDLLGITISETKHKQGPHQGDNTISGQTFSFPVVNSEDFDFSEEERVTRNFLLEFLPPFRFLHNNRHFDEWSALLQVTGFKEELEDETSIDSWALTLTARHTTVPEPSSIFGILAVGTLGAASTLKRKLKPSKSTGRSPV